MKRERTTAPVSILSNFLSVETAARNVFGDASYDSVKLTRDINAVYNHAEQFCERAFLNQTWTITLDKFPTARNINPKAAIYLPYGKVQSVTSVNYRDVDGADQTLVEDTDFHLDDLGYPARLVPTEALGTWPETSEYFPNAVTIVYEVGFGVSIPDDKSDVVDACLLHLGDLYEARQNKTPVQLYDSELYTMLLRPYKIYFDFDLYNDA